MKTPDFNTGFMVNESAEDVFKAVAFSLHSPGVGTRL